MAAFALGLIGDAAAAPALLPALGDADPRVQGRAAEALGLINHTAAAGSIAGMAAAHVKAGALAGIASDDETYPLAPPVESVRLGLFALARLGAVDELRAVVLSAEAGDPGQRLVAAGVCDAARERTGGGAHAAAVGLTRGGLRERGRLRRAASARSRTLTHASPSRRW